MDFSVIDATPQRRRIKKLLRQQDDSLFDTHPTDIDTIIRMHLI